MSTDELLTYFETCPRSSHWAQDWDKNKLIPARMLDIGIRGGLTFDGPDFGEEAGSIIYELGATRGVESEEYDTHSEVVHLSSLSDVIVTAIRKVGDRPWKQPDPIEDWTPSCFLSPDGNTLRRVIAVSSWSDERHNSLCRSWATLGPVAFYDLPLQIGVAVIGNHRNGRYHSFWSRALMHPQNRKIRFRKRNNIAEGFKSSWLEVWRHERDELDALGWINSMAEDQVLEDCLFKIDFPRLEGLTRNRIMDVARRKLEIIQNTNTVPDEQYSSSCSWPIKCKFLNVCSKGESSPNRRLGFVPVSELR